MDESGIRTLERLRMAATYRFFIATDAMIAMNAVGHCPIMPAGSCVIQIKPVLARYSSRASARYSFENRGLPLIRNPRSAGN
jgi:hypothetical protein